MKILNTSSDFFYPNLTKIVQKRSQYNLPSVDDSVKFIIDDVIARGDQALFDYAYKFDGSNLSKDNILLSKDIRLSYKDKMDFEGFNSNKENVIKMAEFEQLDGHNLSVKIRQIDKK